MTIVESQPGSVLDFDDARGIGTIVAAGGERYLFHCIEIADGSRTIEIGRSVLFRTLPRFGQFQAGSIEKR